MRWQGGWKSRGSDRGSSGKVWQKVQFELAKPTHLTAAVRHSRPKSYRTGKLGWVTKFIPLLFHASHHATPDKVCFVWFCLWGSHREALPGPPFLIGIVIFCCLFIASLPLYLNLALALKVLCPASWYIDTQQLHPLWLHFSGCTV